MGYKTIESPNMTIELDIPSCPLETSFTITTSGGVKIEFDLDYEQMKAFATAVRAAKEEMWEGYYKKRGEKV